MSEGVPPFQMTIRVFEPRDLPACRKLYVEGLLGGSLAENDTGLDIDDIMSAYVQAPGSCFWVAEESGEVVGMVGVQQHETSVGEIRRLRVRQSCQRRGIGRKLVERAIEFCTEKHYLKITLDTFLQREGAVKLFERFRFKHDRTRSVHGKELLYFYLDIYGRDQPREGSAALR